MSGEGLGAPSTLVQASHGCPLALSALLDQTLALGDGGLAGVHSWVKCERSEVGATCGGARCAAWHAWRHVAPSGALQVWQTTCFSPRKKVSNTYNKALASREEVNRKETR